ncbi:hypothetical protein VPH35_092888 [Triticum aestivum]
MGETVTNVSEYQAIAKQKLPKMAYDYYASGAEDEWTLKENREAFSRILFRPRILIDVSTIDMTTSVLGMKISMPIMISPTAFQKMAHPEGEYATARAASAAGTVMTLSSWATSSVEEVASTGPGIRFFQLYVYKDRKVVEQLVRRAEKAGFKAIALTVDTPRLGRREADIKNRFVLPPGLTLKNFEGLNLGTMDQANDSGLASYVAGQIDRTLSWKDVKWLQSITTMPILVKGVITAEDARLAVHSGAAGIIVSNHGARQLDYVPATISALEEVVTAAQGRIPVYLDGGVRRGTDVFKALALGASGVFVSHPSILHQPLYRFCQYDTESSLVNTLLADRAAGGVRAGGGGRGRRAERAAHDAGGVRAHHGARRVHQAQRHHPQPHLHRGRPPRAPPAEDVSKSQRHTNAPIADHRRLDAWPGMHASHVSTATHAIITANSIATTSSAPRC